MGFACPASTCPGPPFLDHSSWAGGGSDDPGPGVTVAARFATGMTGPGTLLLLMLADERGHHVDDFFLLSFGEPGHILKNLLNLSGWSPFSFLGGLAGQQIFHSNAKYLGHFNQNIGAGGIITLFPKGDVLLSLAGKTSQLRLT